MTTFEVMLALLAWWPQPDPSARNPRDYQGPLEVFAQERKVVAKPANRKGKKSVAPKKERVHKDLVIPVFRSEPAMGPLFGLRNRYVYRDPKRGINRVLFDVAAGLSVKLVQDHRLTLWLRDFAHRDEVAYLSAEFKDDPVFPFMGIAEMERLNNRQFPARFYQINIRTVGADASYQQPFLRLEKFRGHSQAIMRWFVGVSIKFDKLTPYKDSLLEQVRPDSSGWIRRNVVQGGVVWDSRDNEWSPTWGARHDISLAAAGPFIGASQTWARVNASFRWFRSLGTRKLILANLLVFDGIIGPADVPVVALGEFGGLAPLEGFGGRDTGRGFYRRRFIGPAKMAHSLELRAEPLEFKIKRFSVSPGFKAFVDTGKVFKMNRTLVEDLRVSGGGGVYVVWDRFFVFRLDVGVSEEGYGIYAVSNHTF